MKRVLTAVVLILLVLLALWKAPLWLLAVLVGIVAFLALDEYRHLAAAHGCEILRWPVYVASAAWLGFVTVAARTSFSHSEAMALVGALLVLSSPLLIGVFLAWTMRMQQMERALPTAAFSSLAVFYIVIPLSFIVILREATEGMFALAWIFAIVWSGDICAFYVGRRFGRRKLAPAISPGKSWEGAGASVLGAMAVGVALAAALKFSQPRLEEIPAFHYMESVDFASPWVVAMDAAIINVAAQLGDLVESLLKRGAGIKDSGHLLPGHGGVLDRIDALLFALPIAMLVFVLIPPFGIPY